MHKPNASFENDSAVYPVMEYSEDETMESLNREESRPVEKTCKSSRDAEELEV